MAQEGSVDQTFNSGDVGFGYGVQANGSILAGATLSNESAVIGPIVADIFNCVTYDDCLTKDTSTKFGLKLFSV